MKRFFQACLLKYSETQSKLGALPLFFLAQRRNKGSRSNQIRHAVIHQSAGFTFLRGVASKHMRTAQPAISHCHCVAYQTSALIWCNCSMRNTKYWDGLTSLGGNPHSCLVRLTSLIQFVPNERQNRHYYFAQFSPRLLLIYLGGRDFKHTSWYTTLIPWTKPSNC